MPAARAAGRSCARSAGRNERSATLSRDATPPRGGVFCFRGAMMDFSKLDGLIPAVIQDAASGEVLMVGFMNDEAWRLTKATGFATFFSRSRNTLWTKG